MDPQLRAMLVHRIGIRAFTGYDADGNEQHADVVYYRGRIERRNRLVRASNGEQVVASATIFLEPEAVVDSRSIVVYPDGGEDSIIDVHTLPDVFTARDDHKVVYT